jgi:hypothetical protein
MPSNVHGRLALPRQTSYANNCPGYIPTARIVREGGYEGDTSHRAYFLPAPFEPVVERELEQLMRSALSKIEDDE